MPRGRKDIGAGSSVREFRRARPGRREPLGRAAMPNPSAPRLSSPPSAQQSSQPVASGWKSARMASYFLRSKHISRGKGARVTRAAAYRAGERIRDERTGGTAAGEPLSQFTVADVLAVDDALARQLASWPGFRPIADPDPDGTRFANHSPIAARSRTTATCTPSPATLLRHSPCAARRRSALAAHRSGPAERR